MRRIAPVERERIRADRVADPDLDLHADSRHRLLDGLLQPLGIAVDAGEHAEHELSPDDHLLDVEHVHVVPREHGEQHGRDPGLVRTGRGDEDGSLAHWFGILVRLGADA